MTTKYKVTSETIDVQAAINLVTTPNSGAIDVFIGSVRELTKDKRTLYLKYEAYAPMAEKEMQRIGEEIEKRWEGATVAMIHRTGELAISDIAVVIAVSTPHREAAFEACRYAIERLKETVPIWKREHWDDGTAWLGNQKGFPKRAGES